MTMSLLGFFGAGILLAFTPCVFPMIPILSGIIVGQERISTLRSLQLSVVFVLGMAVTYALAGVAAGYAGSTIQTAMQAPVVIIAFSSIFVLMALSMFGLFDLRMPRFLLNRIQSMSQAQTAGSLAGVAVMGMLSTLIASPCITAPMLSILTYISQTGNAFNGGISLFVLALGMGLPLILFGLTQGTLLPKAGMWMAQVKILFGVLMLGVAIWMLSRLLSGNTVLWLTAILCLNSAIFFVIKNWRVNNSGANFLKGMSGIVFLYGIILLVGAASGHTDVLKPLQTSSVSNQAVLPQQLFTPVTSMQDLQQKLAQAKAAHQPVLLDFFAAWCSDCAALDRNVFANSDVQKLLQPLVLLRVDITNDNAELSAIREQLHVFGVPQVIFYDKDGREIRPDPAKEITKIALENALRDDLHTIMQ